MIKRELGIKIKELLQFFSVVAIIGPRQVGKTTLAKSMVSAKTSIYLDLEYPDDLIQLNEATLFFEEHKDKCIILDEIQRKPDLFPLLRSVIDRNKKPGRFILLGSASPDLLRDSSETLAGRIAYVELTTLNTLEIKKVDQQRLWIEGGFPDIFVTNQANFKTAWYQNFIKTYVERDIPLLGLQVSPTILHRLIAMLCHYNGNILNASELARSMQLTSPTLTRYLHFLSEAFLIRLLPAYFHNGKKRLVKAPKVYVRDTGLLHHILGIKDYASILSNPALGASWEAFVVEQIYQRYHEEFELFYYRTQAGTECDVILVKAGKPVASIEIKFSSTPSLSKGFVLTIEDLKTKNNYIIAPVKRSFMLNKEVEVLSLEDFLKKVAVVG